MVWYGKIEDTQWALHLVVGEGAILEVILKFECNNEPMSQLTPLSRNATVFIELHYLCSQII